MRSFLFRAKRSSALQISVLICFSLLAGFLAVAAVVVRIMLHFGMQYDYIENLVYFEDWLGYQGMESSGAYSFFMSLRPLLIEITRSLPACMWILGAVGTVLILMFIYLMTSAGYHKGKTDPCLRGAEKIPFDIFLPCMMFLVMVLYAMLYYAYDHYLISYRVIGGICIGSAEIFCILVILRITAAKIRTHTLFSGMLTVRLLRVLLACIRSIPFVWKAVLVWGGCLSAVYILMLWLHWIWAFYMDAVFFLIWTLLILVMFFIGIWVILQMNLVRRKAHQLAQGDLEQDGSDGNAEKGKFLFPVLPAFRKCLRDMDCISDGMNMIVEEKMKSERFQTELITNVSHDIKTPLTSIINYLDFLSQEEKKENRDPQVVREYMEVLDRQSVRLKKLIEDLIEASKASTGSLNIQKEPCELGIFLQQLAGEYEERLELSSLKLNLSLPDDKIYVEADGRYLWRVLDNLLQNVCKYAMAGTRVYLQLQEKTGQAIIVMKNISASELNIPAEELMERFVRGDRSRHTEGSGLGLSIARSLTELQGGKFAIDIDGDLFKTAVGFPVIPPPASDETEEMEITEKKETGESTASDRESLQSEISLLQNGV